MEPEDLREIADRFPESAGVYIMKDAHDHFLYIGKAINLRNRVRSYFIEKHETRYQIPFMLKRVSSLEWIATNNESEALILEAHLIRNHKPPYNIDLKDDKRYPYLKITINEHFARLLVVRRVVRDGAKYFGPFTDVKTMRNVMAFAQSFYKLRTCARKLPLKKPVRPCINYSIGRCSGACAGLISEDDYDRNVAMLIQFLKGQRTEITRQLQSDMQEAAEKREYEKAALLRDQINLIRDISKMQRVDLKMPDTNLDVFGIYETARTVYLAILSFRHGLLLSKHHYALNRQLWESMHNEHEAVICQYYQSAIDDPPEEILLPPDKGFNTDLLVSWLASQFNHKIQVACAQRGLKSDLLDMAEKNARLYSMNKTHQDAEAAIAELASLLKLPRIPETIEAFDISNLGEKYAVAGMVHFRNGSADKSLYRRFKIRTITGQNDFAMLMEAVQRRLERLHSEAKPFPDLLLIDGGKGQLSSAAKPLSKYDEPPMIIALAKKEETLYSLYRPDPLTLPVTHPVRKLVEQIRDEVHRWVITYHRNIRGKQFSSSSMELIPGLGAKKSQVLLRHFGSLKRLREASAEEIASVKGFSLHSARQLKLKLVH